MGDREDHLDPGQVVAGRYEVVSPLGQGGMGVVYEAVQRGLGRRVALKILRPGGGDSGAARARFEREARVAAALRHPGVVAVHDFGEDRGRLFIAMERLVGPTLRDLLAEAGPLEVEPLLEVGLGVSSALVAAHAIGLVHRDLKPANVFVEPGEEGRPRVVVADFGLAFILGEAEATGRLTRDGLLCGTPAYLSPEQALGRAVGPKTDVYSLGCTLYEAAAGRPPFEDESEVAVVNRHLFTLPEPLRRVRPEAAVPQALEALLLSMLAKRPEERPDARRVAEGLAEARRGLGERERSRGSDPLLARRDRALDERPAARAAPTLASSAAAVPPTLRLAVSPGGLDEDVALGLAAAGLAVVEARGEEVAPEADALFAPGAEPSTLAALAAAGHVVLSDALPGDMARVSALLAAGVAEAVPSPVRAEELARRVRRAVARARRGGGRP